MYFILPMFLLTMCKKPVPKIVWKLLSEPFDKMYMTRGQGQWPRVTGKNGFRKAAFLLKKSVYPRKSRENTYTYLQQKCSLLQEVLPSWYVESALPQWFDHIILISNGEFSVEMWLADDSHEVK